MYLLLRVTFPKKVYLVTLLVTCMYIRYINPATIVEQYLLMTYATTVGKEDSALTVLLDLSAAFDNIDHITFFYSFKNM